MHKNTLFLIVVLAIIASIVVFVNLGHNTQPTTSDQTISTSPSSTPTVKLLTYQSAQCGISFQYPETLEKLESTGSGVIFVNPNNTGESVILVCQKEIPRVPLTPDKIETVPIPDSSLSANLYHDSSQKDGSPIDKFIFTNPSRNIDIFIAGLGDIFTNVIHSVRML
jgi:hypothetical protein